MELRSHLLAAGLLAVTALAVLAARAGAAPFTGAFDEVGPALAEAGTDLGISGAQRKALDKATVALARGSGSLGDDLGIAKRVLVVDRRFRGHVDLQAALAAMVDELAGLVSARTDDLAVGIETAVDADTKLLAKATREGDRAQSALDRAAAATSRKKAVKALADALKRTLAGETHFAAATTPLRIEGVPETLPQSVRRTFRRSVDVFGIHILATRGVPKKKVLHAANVMAQYLDNDADGDPDNPAVVAEMIQRGAALIMFRNESEERRARLGDDVFDSLQLQNLFAFETRPEGSSPGRFDATLEEVLHLITHVGYAGVYPDTFGEYSCMVTEYVYWGLTSVLGAQSARLDEIGHEWQLNTPELVAAGDAPLFALLTDPQFAWPTVTPDGRYAPGR